jgi:cytochrome c-type biogenesis protein CcmF
MDGTVIEFGLVATSLAFALALAAPVLAFFSLRLSAPALLVSAKHALIANFALVTLACFTIVWSFVELDFSVLYVAQNSNSKLPMIYRITALWGAHEGSLILWLWYLTLFSALAVVLHWRTHPLSMPYVVGVLASLQAAFLGFILFLSSPFTQIHPALPEGHDLNPLLQDPGLVFHPPALYMGYVGFAIPFAFAISALIRGQSGREWVVTTRRWTLFSWLALTSGILLGGYWAYYELGWGGYWAWDPVENASLMPWLTATAFLHSVMAQEKRNLFQSWNIFLIISTFVLSLVGTFLVRSGVLSSVHAFASDPGRGVYILLFLSMVSLASYGLLILRSPRMTGPGTVGSMISREMALLLNNLLFVVATITVLIGTLYPLAVEVLTGDRVSVAAPYFNAVMPPVFLVVILLMAVGPFIPWTRVKPRKLRRLFLLPAVGSGLVLLALIAAGMNQALAIIAITLVAFATLTTVKDVVDTAQARDKGDNLIANFGKQFKRNPRRYGGLIIHLGTLVLIIGVVGSALFGQTATVTLAPGERMTIGSYILTFRGIETTTWPNYISRSATISVSQEGRPAFALFPEKRSYQGDRKMVTTEAAIHKTLAGDLYVVLAGQDSAGRAAIRAFWNPLVNWIWIGWFVIIAGAIVAFAQRIPNRYHLRQQREAFA